MSFERRLRKIPVLPVESLAALGPGTEVRVTGTVRALGDDKTLVGGPITGRLGVYVRTEYHTDHARSLFDRTDPLVLVAGFLLQDATGYLPVDLTHVDTDAVALPVELEVADTTHATFGAGILARNTSDGGHVKEVVIEVGHHVSVAGVLEERAGRLVLAGTPHQPVLFGVRRYDLP